MNNLLLVALFRQERANASRNEHVELEVKITKAHQLMRGTQLIGT
jgi:hypothetical protein